MRISQPGGNGSSFGFAGFVATVCGIMVSRVLGAATEPLTVEIDAPMPLDVDVLVGVPPVPAVPFIMFM
jgi:hypothetical protein